MATNKSAGAADAKKRGSGFNLIDAAIIIIVLGVILGVVAVYNPDFSLNKLFQGWGRKTETNITYVLEFSGVAPGYASSISVGDSVTTDSGSQIGSVAAGVEIGEYEVISYDPDTGDVVKTVHPALSNIIVTVTAVAQSDTVTGYTVNGQRIAVGAEYELVLPGFEGTAMCISLSDEGGAN